MKNEPTSESSDVIHCGGFLSYECKVRVKEHLESKSETSPPADPQRQGKRTELQLQPSTDMAGGKELLFCNCYMFFIISHNLISHNGNLSN